MRRKMALKPTLQAYPAKGTTCFTPDQLQTVSIFFLGHQTAAGATHRHTNIHEGQ